MCGIHLVKLVYMEIEHLRSKNVKVNVVVTIPGVTDLSMVHVFFVI